MVYNAPLFPQYVGVFRKFFAVYPPLLKRVLFYGMPIFNPYTDQK